MKNNEIIDSHAEDVTEEAYERMPIEDFGKSVLSKLGWKEGEPLGKNGNGITKPVLYTARQKGLGLGARPIINPNDINLGKTAQGKRTHNQAFSEEQKEQVMKEGSKVYIYKGQHKGLTGIVVRMSKPQETGLLGTHINEDKVELNVELDINKSEIKIK